MTDMTKKRVVYQISGMEAVTVRRDLEYRSTETGALTADLYDPPDRTSGARIPAVVFVMGYSDLGARKIFGCRFKEMASFISWAELTAASGMVAVTYETGQDPAADAHAVLRYLRENAADLGIDETRIGIWACSGHVPNALSVLMREERESLRCAVLGYGLMLDLDGSTHVAEAAQTYRFANPGAGRSVEDLPREVPLFLARAGQDEFPHLNETLDRFVARALALNLPVTLVNHPTAPHAFDILDDGEASRETIRQMLAFLRFHLRVGSGSGSR